jgi:SAP domain.
MLVHTYYQKPLKPGDIIEVEPGIAERREKYRVARIIEACSGAADQGAGGNASMTVAALREIAKANGVDVSGLKKKDEIIAALQAAGVEV